MTTQDEINTILAQGEQAYKNGKLLENNPYPLYSEKYQRWQRGFANANHFDKLQNKQITGHN